MRRACLLSWPHCVAMSVAQRFHRLRFLFRSPCQPPPQLSQLPPQLPHTHYLRLTHFRHLAPEIGHVFGSAPVALQLELKSALRSCWCGASSRNLATFARRRVMTSSVGEAAAPAAADAAAPPAGALMAPPRAHGLHESLRWTDRWSLAPALDKLICTKALGGSGIHTVLSPRIP